MPDGQLSTLLALFLLPPSAARAWYDDLPSVKVLHPEDANNQAVVDEIFRKQNNSHFGKHRYAVLLTPGVYKEPFGIMVSYYTSVIGVGRDPKEVELSWVESPNGLNTHATNNFWRSVEGVTLRNDVTWAVSQAAPIRRSIIRGRLHLSKDQRYSSGGFMADVVVQKGLSMGTQQQYFFRNVDIGGDMDCPSGWNYVFVGMRGLSPQAQWACSGLTPGKVIALPQPFAAEKPFLVKEESSWYIYVPKFVSRVAGASANIIGSKLLLEKDVFIARPGMSAAEINEGMTEKKGVLVTPGIYELDDPIKVEKHNFVVLGIGYATLVALHGRPAVEVASGLREVRVAGLLLEAGTHKGESPTEPLLLWGTKVHKEYRLPDGAGLVSDVFTRVGSFAYRGCPIVRADTMMQVNSDDVVLDHVWLWHADHDDCGTVFDKLRGKSDDCFTKHGLVVNGRRVTSYGMAAEHTVGGSMVVWNGEEGDVYFYQSEVPYHQPDWGAKGFAGYAVAPNVERHNAHGIGVYVIGKRLEGQIRSAFLLPPFAKVYNLFNVTIGGPNQFGNLACVQDSEQCYGPIKCTPMRCFLGDFPRQKLPSERVQVQLQNHSALAFHTSEQALERLKVEAGKTEVPIIRDEVLPNGKALQREAGLLTCHGRDGIRSLSCARRMCLWALPGLGLLALAALAVRSVQPFRRPAARALPLASDDEEPPSRGCAHVNASPLRSVPVREAHGV